MSRAPLLAALPLAALLLAATGCRVEEPEGSPAEAPPGPDFSLASLEGRTFTLSELRGRPVIIDFWATWCAPCVFQIPVLNAVHEQHRDDGVVVLGISVDAGGREVVAPFAEEQQIRYPVLLGDERLAQEYGAPGFPSLYLIGPDGRIDYSHVGVVSQEELEERLEGLAAGG